MAGWAQTMIIGNVGGDPEMRYLQNGSAVCSFSVAVTRRWTDKNANEQREKTTWYRVSCWRNLAETANTYVRKGTQVMVVGSVEARAYTNNAGEPAASLDLTADNFQLLGSRADNMQGERNDYGSGSSGVDDIPF